MNELFIEYDNLMIGKRSSFSDTFIGKGNKKSMDNALLVMKYAFNKYLRWSPEVLEKRLNKQILVKMHLFSLMQYITYPIEYNKNTDYYYLVTLIYRKHRLTFRDKTVHTYEKIIAGTQSKYPKDYFLGNDGMLRAGICFQYMINHFVSYNNMNDLYYIFASEEGYELLRKYRLSIIVRDFYETPVDFLHFALPQENKNDFYYQYYRFKYLREMVNKNGRKQKTLKNYKLEVQR